MPVVIKRRREISNEVENEEVKSNKLKTNVKRKVLNNISNISQQDNLRDKNYSQNTNFTTSIIPTAPTKSEHKSIQESSEPTFDIDKYFVGNIFLIPEYAHHVYNYLYNIESNYSVKEWPLNKNVTESVRHDIIDWLLGIQNKLNLLQETMHLATYMFDKCIQIMKTIKITNVKLVALCCLSIATKYEEVYMLSFDNFMYMCGPLKRKDFFEMEKEILRTLDYDLGRPTAISFLRRYNMATKSNRLQHTYGKYLIDIALYETSFCHLRPSMIAAAAAYIALCLINCRVDKNLWDRKLTFCSKYSYCQLEVIIPKMTQIILNSINTFSNVMEKYSSHEFLCAVQRISLEKDLLRELSKEL